MNNLSKRVNGSSIPGVWSIVGGAVLLAAAFVFVKNFSDIRRYLKIEMM